MIRDAIQQRNYDRLPQCCQDKADEGFEAFITHTRESHLGVLPNDQAKVILFKPDGKYYTQEYWTRPKPCILPIDMAASPDFRRIDGGPVLVITQEPWGYPHLIV